MNQPSTRSFDRSQFCATCGRKRRPLEQRRESWRFDDTPIVPRRENGPPPLPGYSHPCWQQTNDLIVSCNIYRNGGTNEVCHLCDDCLRVGLRAIKAKVDAALEETGGSDQTTEIVRLTEELGKALHRCSVLETKVARETTPQPDWIDVQVMLERQQQDLQWGGPEHDDGHSDRDWADFIVHQIQRMAQESGRVPSAAPRAIKIMAMCRAWLESMDRRGERLARAARKASDVMCHECGCIYQQEHDQDHNRVCPDCMEGHEPSIADRQADVMP